MLLPLFCSLFKAAPPIDVDGNIFRDGDLISHDTNISPYGQNIVARLNVLSCFIVGQGASQQECVRIGAVSMIEFALFHVAPESLALENPQMLVAAVETLCAAAARGGGGRAGRRAAVGLRRLESPADEPAGCGESRRRTLVMKQTTPKSQLLKKQSSMNPFCALRCIFLVLLLLPLTRTHSFLHGA